MFSKHPVLHVMYWIAGGTHCEGNVPPIRVPVLSKGSKQMQQNIIVESLALKYYDHVVNEIP